MHLQACKQAQLILNPAKETKEEKDGDDDVDDDRSPELLSMLNPNAHFNQSTSPMHIQDLKRIEASSKMHLNHANSSIPATPSPTIPLSLISSLSSTVSYDSPIAYPYPFLPQNSHIYNRASVSSPSSSSTSSSPLDPNLLNTDHSSVSEIKLQLPPLYAVDQSESSTNKTTALPPVLSFYKPILSPHNLTIHFAQQQGFMQQYPVAPTTTPTLPTPTLQSAFTNNLNRTTIRNFNTNIASLHLNPSQRINQ